MKIEHVFSCNLKRKGIASKNYSSPYNPNWMDRSKKEGGNSSSLAVTPPQGKSPTKPNTSVFPIGTRNIKCFKCLGRRHISFECPTRRIMIMKEDGQITSESEPDEEEVEKELEEEALQGDILMVRRLLGSQIQPLEQTQRENIFHTRCSIKGKLCSLIVDGGSCTNVASSRLVSKLNLGTKPHPRPYKLQWLSEDGEMKVTQ
uniref:CCHC-type domain-containing protein n=1 Tax=Cajanus cajan TaxID=3821 RepID=A0A151T8W8_CAJCA|nr:hypothetical protein KK1_018064 [Cajanus cajan]